MLGKSYLAVNLAAGLVGFWKAGCRPSTGGQHPRHQAAGVSGDAETLASVEQTGEAEPDSDSRVSIAATLVSNRSVPNIKLITRAPSVMNIPKMRRSLALSWANWMSSTMVQSLSSGVGRVSFLNVHRS